MSYKGQDLNLSFLKQNKLPPEKYVYPEVHSGETYDEYLKRRQVEDRRNTVVGISLVAAVVLGNILAILFA
ncbi:MAG: hypothetical protein ACXABY_00810 [Candidatus Thorarchaeota archaeon]